MKIRCNLATIVASMIFATTPVIAQSNVSCADLYVAQSDLQIAQADESASLTQGMADRSEAYYTRIQCEYKATNIEDQMACFDEYQERMEEIDSYEAQYREARIAAQEKVQLIEMQLSAEGVTCQGT